MDLRQVLRDALQRANIDDCEAVLDSIQDDSDLCLLLRLADLAGGQQLLKNRIKAEDVVYRLKPTLIARPRKYVLDSQLNFPDIETDPRCEQAELIPVTSERYAFSQVYLNRFENLYRKAQFPSATKLAQLNKQSSLNLAWQCLDAPHADFMKQQAGYIRREVMTAQICDIKADDFGASPGLFNEVELKQFLEIKREIINLMYMSVLSVEELLPHVKKFTHFAYINEHAIVIDWGKEVQYVRDMNMEQYNAHLSSLRAGEQKSNTVERKDSDVSSDHSLKEEMANSSGMDLKNSVAEAHTNTDMIEFVRKAKAAILEEMADFDSITQGMTTDEKNNISRLYIDKLEQMNEMEAKMMEEWQSADEPELENEEKMNSIEFNPSLEHSTQPSVDQPVETIPIVPDSDVSSQADAPLTENAQDVLSNSLNHSDPVEEVGDPEEDYDELSDSKEHEEYMKIIANSPNAKKVPLHDLQDAQINSDAPHLNDDELHEIADMEPEPDACPEEGAALLQQLLASPDTCFVSYVQVVQKRIEAEIPILPVGAYVDFETCFEDMPLPRATKRGEDLVNRIEEKINKMRSKEYLVSIYHEPQPPHIEASSALRVYYDPLRTGAVEIPENVEAEAEVPFVEGETICGRYELLKMCGQATFSNCFSALDLRKNRHICLKVIKNDKEYLDQALDEIHLLELIRELDPEESNRVITVQDYFYFREHLLIVFALYGEDLFVHFDRLQEEKLPSDYSKPVIKDITCQVLKAFDFLHRLGICHLDAKPENILHVSPDFCAGCPGDVRVVDLGSSSFVFDKVHEYIQSRSYRCPEVIFGLPYDTRVDIWSIGAVIAEMLTGRVLFPNHSVATLLVRINALISPISRNFILSGRAGFKYLTGGLVAFEEENGRAATVCADEGLLEIWLFGDARQLNDEDLLISDLIRQMLVVDCSKRPTAEMLLQHFWLRGGQE